MRRPAPQEQDLIPGVVAWDDVDWPAARAVRFHVRQAFTYTYASPVDDVRQRLVVFPASAVGSICLARDFRVDAGLEPAEVREAEDELGNSIVEVDVAHVDRVVTFEAGFVVERRRSELRANWADSPVFRTPTALTEPGPRVRALAAGLPPGSPAQRARAASSAVRAAFRYAHDVTGVRTSAEEALGLGSGVCQDFAHAMIAVCREVGIPARYVSGHLVGEGGTHAWVEVPGDGGEVIGLDPTHDRETGLSYLPVAAGRDYGDVAPTSGTYSGEPGGSLVTARRVAICGIEYASGRLTA